MIILDENIFDGQRLLLEAWRLTARQVGVDLGRKGMKDEEIVVYVASTDTTLRFSRYATGAGSVSESPFDRQDG